MQKTSSPSSPLLSSPKERMAAWKQLPKPAPSWEEFKRMVGQGMTAEQISKAIVKRQKKRASVIAPTDEARSLLAEFLCDEETLKEPFRNEALCEKARKFLGVEAG